MPKINQEEYEILKGLDNRWKWIARDDENQIYSAELYVFERKPEQEDGYWNNISSGEYALLEERDDPFQFIQWEDEEPYEIAELIREYEIKELRLAPSGTVIVDSFDESEETEVKDIEELKSWFEDDKLYVGEYVKHKINRLDEPEKVVIPQFVADEFDCNKNAYWEVDEAKDIPHVLKCAFGNKEKPSEFLDWVRDNPEDYVMAVRNGYEVEKEKLYYVLNGQGYFMLLESRTVGAMQAGNVTLEDAKECGALSIYQLTEKQIKDYDERYWQFAVEVAE